MTEIKTEKAQTHIRIHNRTGFVMGLDMNVPYTDIINLLTDYMAKHGDADTYCESCGERIDGENAGLICDACIQGDIRQLNNRLSELETALATERNQREANARVMQAHIREVEKREQEWNDESDTEWEECGISEEESLEIGDEEEWDDDFDPEDSEIRSEQLTALSIRFNINRDIIEDRYIQIVGDKSDRESRMSGMRKLKALLTQDEGN